MWELSIFIIATVGIIYVSRKSLLAPRSHGFYRFFAWELLLAFFLLQVRGWFRDPFSWHQIISWVLLVISVPCLILGVQALRSMGKPDQQRNDSPMLGFEKTTQLVNRGIYGYIRHPLYASLFYLGWGIFFKDPTWWGGCLIAGVVFFLVMTAKMDEVEDIRFFGEPYREYMKQTKMFVPFVF
jgi:protein-S-isoprenylcysteine O-methyltransferase Ste14